VTTKGDREALKRGRKAARYLGADSVANPGTRFSEYCLDIAEYYGFVDWGEMPAWLRVEARAEFRAGVDAEKEALGI